MESETQLIKSSNSFLNFCIDFLRSLDKFLLCVLAWPIIVVFLSNPYPGNQLSMIDPWVYFGYFLNLKTHLAVFPGAYYGTRLPWILPGFLSYKLFSPLLASYVLHFLFYYSSMISLYLILAKVFCRKTALLTSLLFGSYSHFVFSVTSDYVDGAALSYFFLTLLMITYAKTSRRSKTLLFFSGVFFGCTVFSQLYLVSYSLLVLGYYLYFHKSCNFLKNISLILSGFLVLTFFLCCVNRYFLNSDFLFFSSIVSWTSCFVANSNPWWVPFHLWWKNAPFLLLPTALNLISLVCCAWFFIRERFLKSDEIFFLLFYVVTFVFSVFVEFVLRQPVLQLSYYSSYILPSLFLSLGSVLSLLIKKIKKVEFGVFLIATVFFALVRYDSLFGLTSMNALLSRCMIVGVLLVLVAFLFKKRKSFAFLFVCLVLFEKSDVYCSPSLKPYQNTKESFLAVFNTVKQVQQIDPKARSYFWYGSNSKNLPIFRSVASCYLWGYRLVNEDFPNLKIQGVERLPVANDHIIILTDSVSDFEIAIQNLKKIGLEGVFVNSKTISQEGIFFDLYHLFVRKCS